MLAYHLTTNSTTCYNNTWNDAYKYDQANQNNNENHPPSNKTFLQSHIQSTLFVFCKVKISESRKLINVKVPALRRHEISVESIDDRNTSEYVKINKLDDKRVKVHYKPNVKKLQKLLNSNHALKFSVQYDVERQDEGGEIEVR